MPLYLCRHGQTDWNLEKRFQSRTDVPLNETGLAQAQAMRDELSRRGVVFTLARCSPLSRAVQTAEIILAGTGIEVVPVADFIELEFGGFEAQLEADLREKHGQAYEDWRNSQYTTKPPEGGESIISGAERVRNALMELREPARHGNVLLVAHQAVNMAMKVVISGRSDVESAATFRQDNDEVGIWDMDKGELAGQFRVST